MNTSKTLLQILVEELPKRGGFPIRSTKSVQDADGEIKFHAGGYSLVFEKNRPGIWGSDTTNAWPDYTQKFTPDSLSIDYATAIITREQYEIALEFYRAHEGAKVENLRFVGGVLVGEFTPTRPAERITINAIVTDAEGWIDWAGGECPVDKGTMVEVKYRNGTVKPAEPANHYIWTNGYGSITTTDADIIAYRLHQPKEVETVSAGDVIIAREVETRAEIARAVDDLNECIEQAPAPVWNGCGVPPVGAEIEWRSGRLWYPGTIIAISEMMFIIKDQHGEEGGYYRDQTDIRAANSERDELAAIIEASVGKHSPFVDTITLVASDLIAAGYRKQ